MPAGTFLNVDVFKQCHVAEAPNLVIGQAGHEQALIAIGRPEAVYLTAECIKLKSWVLVCERQTERARCRRVLG